MSRNQYGIIHKPNPMAVIPQVDLAASVAFKYLGGKFAVKDGSNQYAIADSGDTQLAGWLMVAGEFTSSSTAGQDKFPLCVDLGAIFELPADATFVATDVGALLNDTCDLIVASSIQKADIGESTEDVIKIVGMDVTEQTVFAMINPVKFYTAGVV